MKMAMDENKQRHQAGVFLGMIPSHKALLSDRWIDSNRAKLYYYGSDRTIQKIQGMQQRIEIY